MPTAIITFIGQAVSGVVTGLTAIGFSHAAAVGILDFGIKLAAVTFLGNIYENLAGVSEGAQPLESESITTRETLAFQRIIYGETLVSGPIWYINAAGTHNQSLYYGIVLAGHECEDITDMWIDDHEIPEASINWGVDGAVQSGDFRGNFSENSPTRFYKYLGVAGQGTAPELSNNFTEVNTYHRGQGITHCITRLDTYQNQTAIWSGGAPNAIKHLVRGKKVYDPRSDDTQPFGTGPLRLTNSLTWLHSRNAALQTADYMIDNHLGFGEATDRIDWGYVASAAEICDGIVFTPVGTDRRFRGDGVLSTGNSYEENIKRLLSAFNGSMPNVNGTWKMRAWSFEVASLNYSENDLAGPMEIQHTVDEKNRYNTVRASFVDPDRLWKSSESPEFTSSEYVARDDDEKLYRDITLHMTKDIYMAQRLQAGILEQSDLGTTVVFPTNYKTLPAELGGTINVSNTKQDWDNKTFRVIKYKLTDLRGIGLVLREDTATAYTDVGTAEYTVASNGTYNISGIDTPPPSSLWVSVRESGYQVNVTPAPARLSESTKIFASVTSAWADAEEIADIEGDNFLHLIERPTTYYYFARSVDFTGGLSDRLPNSDHTDVVGFPGLFGGIDDPTFDLTEDVDVFYDVQTNSCFIVDGDGENGENALGMVKIGNSNAGAGLRTKQYFPIRTDTLRITTRYRINSNYGTSPNSVFLGMRVYGYHPTPVSSVSYKEQPTVPGSYTQVFAGSPQMILTNSITMDGSWYTISADVDLTDVLDAGATLCRPGLVWAASDSISIDTSLNARHNTFAFGWK